MQVIVKFLVTFLVVLSSYSSYGQIGFEKIFIANNALVSSSFNLIQDNDSNYLVIGEVYDSIFCANFSRIPIILKIDKNGNLIFAKSICNIYPFQLTEIYELKSGIGYLISGTVAIDSSRVGNIVMLMDKSGTINWSKILTDSVHSFISNPIINGIDSSDILLSFQIGNSPFLIDINYLGNINWIKRFIIAQFAPTFPVSHILVLDNNNYLITRNEVIQTISNTGQILNSKQLLGIPNLNQSVITFKLNDSSFLISGGSYGIDEANLIRFDTSFNLVWAINYPSFMSHGACLINDTTILTMQYAYQFSIPPYYDGQFFTFFDLNGNLILTKYVNAPYVSNNFLSIVTKTNDNCFAFPGTFADKIVLCKSNSSYDLDCYQTTHTVAIDTLNVSFINYSSVLVDDTLFEIPDTVISNNYFGLTDFCSYTSLNVFDLNSISIKIYPNPNSGKFTIALPYKLTSETNIQLFSIDGKEVLNETRNASPSITMDSSKLTDGLYLLKIEQGNNIYFGKVSIIK